MIFGVNSVFQYIKDIEDFDNFEFLDSAIEHEQEYFDDNFENQENLLNSKIKSESLDNDIKLENNLEEQNLVPLKFESKSQNHKCTTCDKMFTSQSSLNRHIKSIHEVVKKFTCDKCNRDFGQNADFIRHMKSVHEGSEFSQLLIYFIHAFRAKNQF